MAEDETTDFVAVARRWADAVGTDPTPWLHAGAVDARCRRIVGNCHRPEFIRTVYKCLRRGEWTEWDDDHQTLLHRLARSGRHGTLRWALGFVAASVGGTTLLRDAVERRDENGWTVMHVACALGGRDTADALLQTFRGLRMTTKDVMDPRTADGYSAWQLAILHDQVPTVRWLVDECGATAREKDPDTLFWPHHLALEARSFAVLDWLQQHAPLPARTMCCDGETWGKKWAAHVAEQSRAL